MRFNILKQGGHSGTDGLDAAGGNLSGPLMLFRNPVDNLEAANKQYTDTVLHTLNASNFTSGIIPVERLPAMPGDAANTDGSNVFTLGTTGVSPGSYTRVKVNSKGLVTGNEILTDSDIPELSWSKVATNKPTTLAGYGITDAITASGGVLTGPLYVTGTASSALHIVNKQYVDSIVGSGGSLSVGDTVKKATTITPSGFLKCNGGEVSQTTYSALYSIIGDTYSIPLNPGSGRPWQQQYAINSEQSTDITGWTTGTALPEALYLSQAIVTKNRVYLLGGHTGIAVLSTVYTAPINADGTLGTWTTGTPLPAGVYESQAIVTKNRVYLLGGSNGAGAISTVYTAPINADGTLGTWTTGTPLPGALYYTLAIVTKNRVYLLGGYSSSTVYTATINADGTLGTWTTGTSLPAAAHGSQAIVTKNRVYLLGGSNGSAVHTAPINADGTLGTWTTGTPLPGALYYTQAIVTKNRVYLLGGSNGAGAISTVYTAPINADGTLGTWSAGTALSAPVYASQAIVTKNRVYLLGGSNGTAVSTVYTAPISGGLNDYSSYYDGTYTTTTTGMFCLPDYSASELSNSITYIKY